LPVAGNGLHVIDVAGLPVDDPERGPRRTLRLLITRVIEAENVDALRLRPHRVDGPREQQPRLIRVLPARAHHSPHGAVLEQA